MPNFVRRIGNADFNTNPYYNDRQYVGSGGYYKGNTKYQCVNYCIGRTCELAETRATYFGSDSKPSKTMFIRKGYGNAKEWWNETLWDKTTNPNDVRLGDVVVYGTNWGNGYGHCRIVEAIENDYFICSGGNEDGKGTCKFNIKINKEVGGGSNGKGLMGYIHNPHLTFNKEEKPTSVDYEKLYKELRKKVDNFKESV